MKNMKFLFLLGSAIKHFLEEDFSAFSEQERFNQTLKTIESIRKKVPDSYIVIFECSYKELEEHQKKILKENCDLFLEFFDDPIMQTIYNNIQNNPNYFTFGKSLLETRGLLKSLYHIDDKNLFADCKRIFKISGRYYLNDDFNINDYKSSFLDKKYILKKYDYEENLENGYCDLYQLRGMVVTGLWSFDRHLFNQVIVVLEKSFDFMQKMIIHTSGVDIEHSLYKLLDVNYILSVDNLGISVLKGFDGASYKL